MTRSTIFNLYIIQIKYQKKQIMIRIKEIKYANNTLDNLLIQENSKFSKITSSGSGASSIDILCFKKNSFLLECFIQQEHK